MATVPSNVELTLDKEKLRQRWHRLGAPPLCPYVEVQARTNYFRFRPHFSVLSRSDSVQSWQHVHDPLEFLEQTPLDIFDSRCIFGVAAIDANHTDVGVLATSTDVGEKGSVISHIGWPLLKSTENIRSLRLRDVLERRSNDYWMCDLLSEALFGVDFVYGHCAYDGLRGGVSIIIPAFNVHNTLPAVLDSILTAAGILPPSFVWECIVIDDLSEPPIDIRGYEKYNVQLIRSNKRLSCGGARNLGVFKASQPLVMFCDGDIVLDKDYIKDHITRHFLMPNLITLSFRERLAALTAAVSRSPRVESDTRFHAFYDTTWIGFNKITAATEVSPYSTTRAFRDFGFGRTVGPTNLQFMAKGNNLVMPRWLARLIRFPDDFVGWGPEDVCFAAESIAHGAFVTPVMCTAVFHIDHPPRSGDLARQNSELKANLCRYDARLNTIWNFRRDADFLRDITPGAL